MNKEELKTLKDMEIGIHFGDMQKVMNEKRELGSDFTTSILLAGDLKQEAIKWLKKIDHPIEDRDVKDKLKLVTIEADNCLYGARRFIIEFFNITDEDL